MYLQKLFIFVFAVTSPVLFMPGLSGTPGRTLSLTWQAAFADDTGRLTAKERLKSPPTGEIPGNAELLLDTAYYPSLMKDLSHAHESIAIILYLFKTTDYRTALPDRLVHMLVRKHAQGVDVSLLLNVDRGDTPHGMGDSLNDTNLHTAKRLEDNGIRVYLDSPRRTTHAKVVVIDKKIVYIGSHNFTQSALRYNHEVSVRIVSPDMAKEIISYMEALKNEK